MLLSSPCEFSSPTDSVSEQYLLPDYQSLGVKDRNHGHFEAMAMNWDWLLSGLFSKRRRRRAMETSQV
jgi:hypothetical protein